MVLDVQGDLAHSELERWPLQLADESKETGSGNQVLFMVMIQWEREEKRREGRDRRRRRRRRRRRGGFAW